MFTLIKREIEDHIAYFVGAAALSAIFVILLISTVYLARAGERTLYPVGLSLPAIILLIIGLPALGVSQMSVDRTRRISAFLSALPVTRSRILAARIITGILAILTVLLPLPITGIILWNLYGPRVPMSAGPIFDMSVVAFLMALACYCLGLQTGWTSNKIAPTLGGLTLTCILVPLILVKGPGLHTAVILVLFIVASLTRTWHKFTSTAL
jgi:ABC-type transport system involved in multi-copper enzyme maturation permease subunit